MDCATFDQDDDEDGDNDENCAVDDDAGDNDNDLIMMIMKTGCCAVLSGESEQGA